MHHQLATTALTDTPSILFGPIWMTLKDFLWLRRRKFGLIAKYIFSNKKHNVDRLIKLISTILFGSIDQFNEKVIGNGLCTTQVEFNYVCMFEL